MRGGCRLARWRPVECGRVPSSGGTQRSPEAGYRGGRAMALQPFVDQDVPGPKRDYVGYGRHVPKVRWPDDARVAVNIVLNYEEGSEYTHPAGDGQNDGLTEIPWGIDSSVRDLAAESVYEYGSRAGVWRVQRLVDGLGLPMTFFAAATALERNPEVAAWLRESHPRAVQPRLALGGGVAARARPRAPARPVGHRVVRGDGGAAAPRLVLPLRAVRPHPRAPRGGGRLRLRRGRLQRRPPLFHRGHGQAPPHRALQLHLQRRPLRAAPGLRFTRTTLRRPSSAASTPTGRRAPSVPA